MWLILEPLDVLLFRDGKPFNAGGQNDASSFFPPSAFSLQGLLRSLVIEHSGISWDDAPHDKYLSEEIGTVSELGQFKMKGPYLARYDGELYERVFPIPSDVVSNEKVNPAWHGRALCPNMEDTHLVIKKDSGSYKLYPLDIDTESDPPEKMPDSSLWITESMLELYLEGDDVDETIQTSDLYEMEYRTGNAIDYTVNRVQDGMLYSVQFVRLRRNVVLLVQVPNDSAVANLFVNGQTIVSRFGGEGHGVKIRQLHDGELRQKALPDKPPSDRYKIVWLTPTYFRNGNLPEDTTLVPPDQFVSARLGSVITYGGWNVAESKPRTIHRYIPAGSVMYFEGGSLKSPLVEQPEDCFVLSQLGFGEFVYGTWD